MKPTPAPSLLPTGPCLPLPPRKPTTALVPALRVTPTPSLCTRLPLFSCRPLFPSTSTRDQTPLWHPPPLWYPAPSLLWYPTHPWYPAPSGTCGAGSAAQRHVLPVRAVVAPPPGVATVGERRLAPRARDALEPDGRLRRRVAERVPHDAARPRTVTRCQCDALTSSLW